MTPTPDYVLEMEGDDLHPIEIEALHNLAESWAGFPENEATFDIKKMIAEHTEEHLKVRIEFESDAVINGRGACEVVVRWAD